MTPQQRAILDAFRRANPAGLRFQHIAPPHLQGPERAAAIHSLVARGILTPLSGGEYWLTDKGLGLMLTETPNGA